MRSRDRGNVTGLGQAPVSKHKGRSQALRPHPDLDGYPQTRKWIQTTGESGLMMLQRDGHLRVMSRSEQCQDGLETKTKTSRPCGQTEMQHRHLRGADLPSPRTSPGNLNQLLHLWRHLSSSQGFLTHGWRVAALQEVEQRGNLPKSIFLLAWRDSSTEINSARSSRGQGSSPSTIHKTAHS